MVIIIHEHSSDFVAYYLLLVFCSLNYVSVLFSVLNHSNMTYSVALWLLHFMNISWQWGCSIILHQCS